MPMSPLQADSAGSSSHYTSQVPYCRCKKLARLHTSWTDTNPCRRFYRCMYWGCSMDCKFFMWLDEPLPEATSSIIRGLLFKDSNHCLEKDAMETKMNLLVSDYGDMMLLEKKAFADWKLEHEKVNELNTQLVELQEKEQVASKDLKFERVKVTVLENEVQRLNISMDTISRENKFLKWTCFMIIFLFLSILSCISLSKN